MMPKLDGFEVCRRLKSDASLPFMPIILVTAKADTKDVVAGLDAGADEYLTKPIDQAALVARVRSVLRLKALHDQVHGAGGGTAQLEPHARSSASPSRSASSSARAASSASSRRRSPSSIASGDEARARKPSPRRDRGVLRPARLHRLFRGRRARGGDRGAARLSRRPRRAHPRATKARSNASPATA